MPFNGSGTFTLSQPSFTPGTTISSNAVNLDLNDIATFGLSKCVTVDGQNTITGQLKFPDGTAAAPSHTFSSDLTTGMYRAGTKKLGLSAGGTASVFIDQNNVGSGQTGNQLYYANGAIPGPVGACMDWPGPSGTVPTGWLLCFGQVVNVSAYPELFVALGSTNTYGGNGTTTFGIPDYRGYVSAGKDNMGGSAANRIGTVVTDAGTIVGTTLGSTGGSSTHVQTTGELVTHTHTVSDPQHSHSIPLSTAGQNYQSGANSAPVVPTGQAYTTGSAVTGISINNAGSSTAMAWLQPTIIVNKIIFAGRP